MVKSRHRPGSLLSTEPEGPQPRWGIRVGKLEVKTMNRWGSIRGFELHESTSVNPDLPEPVQRVVVNLEAAIKLGLPLLQLYVFTSMEEPNTKCIFFTAGSEFYGISASAWALHCVSQRSTFSPENTENLITISSWIAKTLEGVLAGTRELGLVERTFADLDPLSGPSKKERAAFSKFSVETNKQHGSIMDGTARSSAIVSFGLQLKEIEA
jgi:hypothetical protein